MIGGGLGVNLIWAIGILVLCISSLMARRVPLKGAVRIGLIWVAIFVAAYLIINLITDLT
ncbi:MULTISPECIES: hypothetical protein [Novosphingopyxis]|uniref:hypothetical protein n=1 Tax=Novosphingopyxis TaxID=2709686 RepID=UPI00165120F3|nr:MULTISPECIES: hypothetical protein [Novosphingopyxis]MBH9538001.1 hypothetical protein [Novosphingopyxis sp. YJ-S2-01]